MKVIIGEIYFTTDEDDQTNSKAEVIGDYQIVDMTEEELNAYDDAGGDWVSEEYKGRIYHIEEIKL
jgi:hypothetical protein